MIFPKQIDLFFALKLFLTIKKNWELLYLLSSISFVLPNSFIFHIVNQLPFRKIETSLIFLVLRITHDKKSLDVNLFILCNLN
jgi:hypothetical protein